MIRSQFQRQIAALLRQLTHPERQRYLALRQQGWSWVEAITFGVTLPDVATALAAFQAQGTLPTRH